jgi:hypothetical protein
MKRHVEQWTAQINADVQYVLDEKQKFEYEIDTSLKHAGLSQELYNLYLAFCESCDPEFSQRRGFSTTQNADHEISYVDYDPKFAIFKECIEIPYVHCNFRCEALTISKGSRATGKDTPGNEEYVVNFWPLRIPEALMGSGLTWGEQYVCLISIQLGTSIFVRSCHLPRLFSRFQSSELC